MNTLHFNLQQSHKLYFASDFHLGTPNRKESFARELKIIRWLDQVKNDAEAVFLVGDIFDFWWEYKYVVPKGHVRFLGKVAELADKGIPVIFFTGNHDLWMRNYLTDELGVQLYHDPIEIQVGEQKLFVGHGDGLGPGDATYKFLKKLFKSKILQWIFTRLHPNFSFWLATNWSKKSRAQNLEKEEPFLDEKEWLFQFAKAMEQKKHYDYYIFGHRHMALQMKVSPDSTYINLGEWLGTCSYVSYDGANAELLYFEK